MARRHSRAALGGDQRTDARERALILLYEAESKGVAPRDVLAAQVIDADQLTRELVEGVEDRRHDLDQQIAATAKGWTLARMATIDLMVMRIAGYELAARVDVPVAVILDEAVELAKRFSTDDSPRFVNGVLAAMVPRLRPGVAAETTAHDAPLPPNPGAKA